MWTEPGIVCSETEIAFLITYRQADAAGKRRLDRLLTAGVRGLLPPASSFAGPADIDRFLDSLEARQ